MVQEVKKFWVKANTLFDLNLVEMLKKKHPLMKMCTEGKNLTPEELKWMSKKVQMNEIAGIDSSRRKWKPRSGRRR